MREWIIRYFLKGADDKLKVDIAKELLEEIQAGSTYSIKNVVAEKIMEAVVKSSGNKIVDFVLRD